MAPEIYRVAEIDKGFLSVMARPAGEWLDDEVNGLKKQGVDLVVSLLTDAENHELGLEAERDSCERVGIRFESHPILDRGLPDQTRAFCDLAREIHRSIALGTGAVVHCRAGIGRSGLLAGAVLVCDGYSPAEAFDQISEGRRVRVPDTTEQMLWLDEHCEALQGMGS